jgi:Raf kinase inhibitor-like YbhB/YbcL family protein
MKSITTIVVIIIIIIIGTVWYRSAHQASNSANANVNVTISPTVTPTPEPVNTAFTLSSPAFADNGSIPADYTCDANPTMNPPLSWENAPTSTKSFALTVHDPDVPKAVLAAGFFDHWVVFNIPATTTQLSASSTVGIMGNNGSGKAGYTGPCPPPQYEPKEHRYIFNLYALDTMLNLKKGATRAQVEKAVQGHIIATSTLVGRYQRK